MAELPRTRRADLLFDVPSQTPIRALSTSQVRRVGLDAASDYQKTLAQTNVNVQKMLAPIVQNYAETSAYEYVANRPLTKEQIQKAKTGDVTEIKGSPLTVRGQVINKLRALEVANRLTIEVEKNLLGLLPDIENGVLSTDETEIKIQEILDGASGSVKQLDPEVNLRLRANLARTGNNILTKAYDAQIKKNQQLSIASANTALDSLSLKILNIFSNISNYPKMSPGEDGQIVETLDQAIAAEVENTVSILSTLPLPPSLAASMFKSVSTRKDAAIEDGFKAFLTNPEYLEKNGGYYQILTKLSQNIIPGLGGDGNQDISLGILYNTIPSRHAAIESHVYQANNRQINYLKRIEEENKEKNEIKKNELVLIANNLIEEGSPESLEQLVDVKQQLFDMGVPQQEISSLINPSPFLSSLTVSNIMNEIDDGLIVNNTQLFERIKSAGGSGADRLKLMPYVKTARNQKIKELRRLAGIVETPLNEYQAKLSNQAKFALDAAYVKALAEAAESNTEIDELEFLKDFNETKLPTLKEINTREEFIKQIQPKFQSLQKNKNFKEAYKEIVTKSIETITRPNPMIIPIDIETDMRVIDVLELMENEQGNLFFTEEEIQIMRNYFALQANRR
jgi:hypothetical protein